MYKFSRQLQNCLRPQRICYYILNKTCNLQTDIKLKPNVKRNELPVFSSIIQYPNKIAIRDSNGSYTYASLFIQAKNLAKEISHKISGSRKEHVLFLCENNLNYVITLWAIWLAGHVAVPVHYQQPKSLLLYFANDINSKLIITTKNYADLMQSVAKNVNATLHILDDKLSIKTAQSVNWNNTDLQANLPPSHYTANNALILYTSGTTSSPKGVAITYQNLNFQINCLHDAWKWNAEDCILHTLPLNHVHGIINALLCPLSIGATTLMLPKFEVNAVWTQLLAVNMKTDDAPRVNIYMAVPTIYSKLIEGYYRLFKDDAKMVAYIKSYMKNKFRLMVSGSAPLPIPVFQKWEEISGHKLLERYGMTETGMVLSNSYTGERISGSVGLPLPGVSVKLVQDGEDITNTKTLLSCSNKDNSLNLSPIGKETIIGDLLVKSDGVFKEYLNRKSMNCFSHNDYFITGDVAAYIPNLNVFKILGRKSADIIKSGGHKISALEIESEILKIPGVKECVVVGKPDEQYGEIVAVVLVYNNDDEFTLKKLIQQIESKVPKYALPRVLKVVDAIPKNTMGKVNKKDVVSKWFAEKFVKTTN